MRGDERAEEEEDEEEEENRQTRREHRKTELKCFWTAVAASPAKTVMERLTLVHTHTQTNKKTCDGLK